MAGHQLIAAVTEAGILTQTKASWVHTHPLAGILVMKLSKMVLGQNGILGVAPKKKQVMAKPKVGRKGMRQRVLGMEALVGIRHQMVGNNASGSAC